MRKLTALIAAAILGLTTLAPAAADARDGRGRGWDHDRSYNGGHYDRSYRRHDDHGDAVAAGAVGLILGLALGSIASHPRHEPPRYDNRGSYGPPTGYQGYAPSYSGGSAYERDYGYAPQGYDQGDYEPPIQSRCMRAERQWDRYANRYVTVDVPC